MFLRLFSVTKILYLLIVQKTLPVKTAGNCESATLSSNPTLIDDCELVNDQLKINVLKFTKPLFSKCVRKINLRASEPHLKTDIGMGGQTQVTIANPLDGANRCVPVRITVWVTFGSYYGPSVDLKFDTVVRPIDRKCLDVANVVLTSRTDWVSANLADPIPMKHWETCIYSVAYGHTTNQPPDRPLIAKFEANTCKTEVIDVFYTFKGTLATTIKKSFSLLGKVSQVAPYMDVIQDCDILEDDFTIAINQIITRPECNTETYVKVGSLPGTFYRDQVGGSIEKRRNPLGNPDQNSEVNRCLKTSVTVKVEADGKKYQNNFELNPLKCFDSNVGLKSENGEKNTIFVNLKRGEAFSQKLFDICLTNIEIYDQDKKEVSFEKVPGL